jgi:hypothetical protein
MKRNLFIIGLVVVMLLIVLPRVAAQTTILYVSPSGSDANACTQAAPCRTVQRGLDLAQPGTTIQLAPGRYLQNLVTKRHGRVDAPITIKGPSDAVLTGSDGSRGFQIHHDYHVVHGVTLDGARPNGTFVGRLIYVVPIDPAGYVTGVRILGVNAKNADGECIRFKRVRNSSVSYSTIVRCGIADFERGDGGKNGEAIYIGTAPEQLDGAPPDVSRDNRIARNRMDTRGNECVDIKEHATSNIVEYNYCTGQRDESSAGFDSRGNGNTFRWNVSQNNLGAGVRLGGDTETDGIDNHVYGNRIFGNQRGGIKVQRWPQGRICGNVMDGNVGGDGVGSYGDRINPEVACPSDTPQPNPAEWWVSGFPFTDSPAAPTQTTFVPTVTATRTSTPAPSRTATPLVTRTPTIVPVTRTPTPIPAFGVQGYGEGYCTVGRMVLVPLAVENRVGIRCEG